MKVKHDHRSLFPNLSSWKEEAWKPEKNQDFNGIRTRDLRDIDLRDIELFIEIYLRLTSMLFYL